MVQVDLIGLSVGMGRDGIVLRVRGCAESRRGERRRASQRTAGEPASGPPTKNFAALLNSLLQFILKSILRSKGALLRFIATELQYLLCGVPSVASKIQS